MNILAQVLAAWEGLKIPSQESEYAIETEIRLNFEGIENPSI